MHLGIIRKSVADKLEVENKQMADRLQQLKLTLKKQKAQRGGKAKGVIWRSASITKSGIKTVEKGAAGRRRPRLPGSGGKRGGAAATAAAAAAPPSRRITTDQVAPLPPSQMPAFEAAPPPARPPSTSVNDPADMLELKGEESDVTPEEASGSGEEFDEDAGYDLLLQYATAAFVCVCLRLRRHGEGWAVLLSVQLALHVFKEEYATTSNFFLFLVLFFYDKLTFLRLLPC